MDIQTMSYNDVRKYVFSYLYDPKYDEDLKKYQPELYYEKYSYKFNYHYPDYDLDE